MDADEENQAENELLRTKKQESRRFTTGKEELSKLSIDDHAIKKDEESPTSIEPTRDQTITGVSVKVTLQQSTKAQNIQEEVHVPKDKETGPESAQVREIEPKLKTAEEGKLEAQ